MQGSSFLLSAIIALIQMGLGYCLRCYVCENHINPACGMYFKAYQFDAKPCEGHQKICALQRQPVDDEGWVGIVRGCYDRGTLTNINETDGCRTWTNEINITFTYCFCSTDYCNTASTQQYSYVYTLTVVLMFLTFL